MFGLSTKEKIAQIEKERDKKIAESAAKALRKEREINNIAAQMKGCNDLSKIDDYCKQMLAVIDN